MKNYLKNQVEEYVLNAKDSVVIDHYVLFGKNKDVESSDYITFYNKERAIAAFKHPPCCIIPDYLELYHIEPIKGDTGATFRLIKAKCYLK